MLSLLCYCWHMLHCTAALHVYLSSAQLWHQQIDMQDHVIQQVLLHMQEMQLWSSSHLAFPSTADLLSLLEPNNR